MALEKKECNRIIGSSGKSLSTTVLLVAVALNSERKSTPITVYKLGCCLYFLSSMYIFLKSYGTKDLENNSWCFTCLIAVNK